MFFHAANTSLVTYGVAKHKLLMYYRVAVFFHFASNALTFAGDFGFISGLGIIALVYYLAYAAYTKSSDSSRVA